MAGAGMSTSAGIPDFRSPKTGVYSQLAEKYDLSNPQAVFSIEFFLENPELYYEVSRDKFFSKLKPTLSHYFVRLLHEKGFLRRIFTQNVDTLDRIAGVPDQSIVEAHGSIHTFTCQKCNAKYTRDWVREQLELVSLPRCNKNSPKCDGVLRPDVVLFGESLPARFFKKSAEDFPNCDLLLIMGTSLVVQPFCGLIDKVASYVPRVLINKEKVGQRESFSVMERLMGMQGLDFDSPTNTRDVFEEGTCDDGCRKLAKLLGWEKELDDMIANEWRRLDIEYAN